MEIPAFLNKVNYTLRDPTLTHKLNCLEHPGNQVEKTKPKLKGVMSYSMLKSVMSNLRSCILV